MLHRVFAILGVLIAASGILMALWFLQGSEQARGSGPFAGLGELVVAAMSIVIAAFGACLFGIWAFARLAGFGRGR
ncbi:MAG: hypothetical protein A3J29_07070 [Acidobacteria bacterium RIFCSPLOWO2_12_FULL_67_14b]|nr:MAG: hypothetical protein A3J29_07070 [Acidobacteria bacterium RIFCSPLOWO2_12_FULL_67_14b]